MRILTELTTRFNLPTAAKPGRCFYYGAPNMRPMSSAIGSMTRSENAARCNGNDRSWRCPLRYRQGLEA